MLLRMSFFHLMMMLLLLPVGGTCTWLFTNIEADQ